MKEKIGNIIFLIIIGSMMCAYLVGAILFFSNSRRFTNIRKERATIIEVDNDYYVVETRDGNLWGFYSDRTFFPHDTVLLTFNTKDTPDIYDDEIISIK